jgi:hypothetical protein
MKAVWPLPDVPAVVEAALEGLVLADLVLIESGLVPPFPEDTDVVYRLEPPGEEVWKLAHDVLADGFGDCEDMAAWNCAGLRYTGEDEGARVVLIKTGVNKLHAVVLLSNGEIEDVTRRIRPKDGGKPRPQMQGRR